MDDISTLNQKIEDLRDDLNKAVEQITALSKLVLVETELVRAKNVGIGLEDGQQPQAALDVRGPVQVDAIYVKQNHEGSPAIEMTDHVRGSIIIDRNPPRIYGATGENNTQRYLQLLDSPTSRGALGLKAGGVLVSDIYAVADPAEGELIVQRKVQIGGIKDKDKQPVVGELKVEGNAAVSGEIIEGGKKLAEKYQPKANYQPKGSYLESGKDAKVKNLAVVGELNLGGIEPGVLQLGQIRLEVEYWKSHGPLQGNFPATAAEWPSTARKLIKISFTAFNKTTNKWEKIPVKFDNSDWPK